MMQKTTPTGLMDSFSQLTKHLDTKDASTLNSNATITPPLEWLGMPIDLRETRRVAQKNVDYVLSPIIPAGRATLVTGVGASSKSMLLKQMAIAVAIGRDFLGLSVPTPGKAVLILAEDTSEDAHRSLDVEWHPKLSHFEENLHPNLSHPNRLSCLIFEQGWARSDQRGNFEQITQTCPSRQGLHPAS